MVTQMVDFMVEKKEFEFPGLIFTCYVGKDCIIVLELMIGIGRCGLAMTCNTPFFMNGLV